MLVTYLRSSSYGTYDFCQMQYYLRYVLNIEDKSNLKAVKGCLCHKALELLARRKVAEQNGHTSVVEEEIGREYFADKITPEMAVAEAWEFYTKVESPEYAWGDADLRDVHKWVDLALNYNGGAFDPRNRDVVWPEKYFDFEVEQPWANYDYEMPDGSRLKGRLAIKGTIDLVCRMGVGPNTYELIDWKTGQRKDWATGEPKDYEKLRKDPQLRLYHYALSRLLPDADDIFITIVFVRDGGPFSLPFGRDDIPETEEMLRRRFDAVQNNYVPRRILNDAEHNWKCKRLCHYGKSTQAGTALSVCEYQYRELTQLGMDRAFARHANVKLLGAYGTGGGRSAKETEG